MPLYNSHDAGCVAGLLAFACARTCSTWVVGGKLVTDSGHAHPACSFGKCRLHMKLVTSSNAWTQRMHTQCIHAPRSSEFRNIMLRL